MATTTKKPGEKYLLQLMALLQLKRKKFTEKVTEPCFNKFNICLKTRKTFLTLNEIINKSELNETLRKFYVEVRKQDGS